MGVCPRMEFYEIMCKLIVLVMTAIKMVYSLVNSIPLANYDVKFDVTSIAEGTPF